MLFLFTWNNGKIRSIPRTELTIKLEINELVEENWSRIDRELKFNLEFETINTSELGISLILNNLLCDKVSGIIGVFVLSERNSLKCLNE